MLYRCKVTRGTEVPLAQSNIWRLEQSPASTCCPEWLGCLMQVFLSLHESLFYNWPPAQEPPQTAPGFLRDLVFTWSRKNWGLLHLLKIEARWWTMILCFSPKTFSLRDPVSNYVTGTMTVHSEEHIVDVHVRSGVYSSDTIFDYTHVSKPKDLPRVNPWGSI